MKLDDNDKDLWAAYRATVFRADTPLGKLSIRVGEVETRLDALLSDRNAQEWAFITAHNPGSRQLDEAENMLRHEQIEAEVSRLGYQFFAGRGVGRDPEWLPEDSLLVVGISRDDAIEVGRTFGQNAVVCGCAGQPAELVDCRPKS